MPVPELDPEARQAALAKAATSRRIRAEVKRDLKDGRLTLDEVLDRANSDDALAKMRVSEVVEAMPSYGPVRARALMEELRIATGRRVQGLGSRQRAALLAALGSRS